MGKHVMTGYNLVYDLLKDDPCVTAAEIGKILGKNTNAVHKCVNYKGMSIQDLRVHCLKTYWQRKPE